MEVAGRRGDWRSTLARFGLTARGVLYVVLGILVVRVATGDVAASEASRTGAIETVASQPFGQWLLAVLTAGLLSLALWRALQAITGDPVEGRSTSERVQCGAKGVAYLLTGATALGILLSNLGESPEPSGGGSDEAQAQEAATFLLDLPGGRLITGLLGLLIVAGGAYVIHRHAVKETFLERLALPSAPGQRSAVELVGRAGYAALGLVAAAVGTFLVVAAVRYDPAEAKGLSGVLAELAAAGWGRALLWVVALGLVLYGLFSFADARFRRAT